MRDAVAGVFGTSGGLVFIGAAGIAVRALAPCLRHKSLDPPAVVIDVAGRFAISLLSGHWGGANSLARWLASLIGAEPVITTSSDVLKLPALDEILAGKGLKIIDWDISARAQASLESGGKLRLYSPRMEIGREDIFEPVGAPDGAGENPGDAPLAVIDYLPGDKRANVMRVAIPRLCAGIGFRKNCPSLREDFFEGLRRWGVPVESLAAIATVEDKKKDERLIALAEELGMPLLSWAPEILARAETPNPSAVCGRRFGQRPFSVAESSALMAAGGGDPENARLLLEKKVINKRLTLAVAGPLYDTGRASR
ncbi:MAG: cobalamin biosynthesis protein [Desulfovibrio sp.]|nr:cobalamin biosynthesis protein [Desulfovibrio sp.]